MTTKAKAAESTPSDRSDDESAFTDITDAVEQAQKDAERPVEYDDDGNPKPLEPSEATREVADEMAVRAAAQAEGGGPWPKDLLERFIGSGQRMRAAQPEYTSHEGQDKSS